MPFSFLCTMAGLMLMRSWRATAIVSFMVVSAVAALVFLSALAIGTNDAMIRNSTGLYSGHITGSNLREETVSRLQLAGVKQILMRKQENVLLSAGDLLEPVTLVGIEPEKERQATAFWRKTVEGTYPQTGSNALLLSQELAKRLHLGVDDTIRVMNRQGQMLKQMTVGGIFKTGITVLDQGLAFCPVESLPADAPARSAAIFLADGVSAEDLVRQYRQLLPTGTFASWIEFMPDLKQLIDLDYICMALVITLVFAIVSVGISCTFLIFTLKNLREHGIMKAMGLRPGDTALLLVIQIGALTGGAALIGLALGAAIAQLFAHIGIDISTLTSHNQYFSVSGVLYPRLTGLALVTPPAGAIIFGLAASIWPIMYITRKTPADILRSV